MEENQEHIPKGWTLTTLGDSCKIKKGAQFNRVELSDSGMYPCINGGVDPSGYSDLWNTDAGTITISEGGNSCGYVNFLNTKFWSGGHCYSLLDVKSDINNYFLYQALKGKQNQIMDLRVGSGLPNIQQKAIKEFEFLYPDSKIEQSEIANILSKVDQAIFQTEKLISKYSQIKTGLMQDLLTKGVDENGNIRSEETHEFKDSPLGRIPKEWEVKRLDQMTKNHSPIVYGILMPGKHFHGGIPVIKVKDIFDEKVHIEGLLQTTPLIANSFKRSELKEGDLLFTIRGTVGRCAFVPKELEGANITQDTARIRVKTMYKDYLRYAFETPVSQFYIQLNTIGQAVKGINLKALRELNIPIPPPNEAQFIADKLNGIRSTINIELNKRSKLQSLKTGLMQDLLSGKVRVNDLIKETTSV